MKIKPKSSELSKDEKMLRAMKNALNYTFFPDDKELTDKEKEFQNRVIGNLTKFYENTSKRSQT